MEQSQSVNLPLSFTTLTRADAFEYTCHQLAYLMVCVGPSKDDASTQQQTNLFRDLQTLCRASKDLNAPISTSLDCIANIFQNALHKNPDLVKSGIHNLPWASIAELLPKFSPPPKMPPPPQSPKPSDPPAPEQPSKPVQASKPTRQPASNPKPPVPQTSSGQSGKAKETKKPTPRPPPSTTAQSSGPSAPKPATSRRGPQQSAKPPPTQQPQVTSPSTATSAPGPQHTTKKEVAANVKPIVFKDLPGPAGPGGKSGLSGKASGSGGKSGSSGKPSGSGGKPSGSGGKHSGSGPTKSKVTQRTSSYVEEDDVEDVGMRSEEDANLSGESSEYTGGPKRSTREKRKASGPTTKRRRPKRTKLERKLLALDEEDDDDEKRDEEEEEDGDEVTHSRDPDLPPLVRARNKSADRQERLAKHNTYRPRKVWYNPPCDSCAKRSLPCTLSKWTVACAICAVGKSRCSYTDDAAQREANGRARAVVKARLSANEPIGDADLEGKVQLTPPSSENIKLEGEMSNEAVAKMNETLATHTQLVQAQGEMIARLKGDLDIAMEELKKARHHNERIEEERDSFRRQLSMGGGPGGYTSMASTSGGAKSSAQSMLKPSARSSMGSGPGGAKSSVKPTSKPSAGSSKPSKSGIAGFSSYSFPFASKATNQASSPPSSASQFFLKPPSDERRPGPSNRHSIFDTLAQVDAEELSVHSLGEGKHNSGDGEDSVMAEGEGEGEGAPDASSSSTSGDSEQEHRDAEERSPRVPSGFPGALVPATFSPPLPPSFSPPRFTSPWSPPCDPSDTGVSLDEEIIDPEPCDVTQQEAVQTTNTVETPCDPPSPTGSAFPVPKLPPGSAGSTPSATSLHGSASNEAQASNSSGPLLQVAEDTGFDLAPPPAVPPLTLSRFADPPLTPPQVPMASSISSPLTPVEEPTDLEPRSPVDERALTTVVPSAAESALEQARMSTPPPSKPVGKSKKKSKRAPPSPKGSPSGSRKKSKAAATSPQKSPPPSDSDRPCRNTRSRTRLPPTDGE